MSEQSPLNTRDTVCGSSEPIFYEDCLGTYSLCKVLNLWDADFLSRMYVVMNPDDAIPPVFVISSYKQFRKISQYFWRRIFIKGSEKIT